jgi:hypothetical protein
MAEWFGKRDPLPILALVEKNRIVKKDGKPGFKGLSFWIHEIFLYDLVDFHKSIPETERRRIIGKALFAAGAKGEINEKSLLAEICDLEKEYLKRRPINYVLTTSISLDNNFPLKKIYINSNKINLTFWLPQKYLKEIRDVFNDAKNSLVSEPPANYLNCRVYLKAKSHHEVVDESLRNVDIIRGIFNLYYNSRRGWGITSGIRKPMNTILLGPLHFVHYPGGKLVEKSWWYERDYRAPISTLFVNKTDEDKLVKFYRLVRIKLAKHQYRRTMEEIIIRYNRALDEWNWDNSFIKLWNILEFLTGSVEVNNKKVVDRLLFFSANRKYDSEILNTLRLHRNSFVHESTTTESIEAYVYTLKRWVEYMLWFHLVNPCGLKSPAEGVQFFDLPTEKEALRKKMSFAKYALRLKRATA